MKNKRCTGALVLLFFLIFSKLAAQSFQFSQYNFTSQRVNPALTGLTHFATLSTLYRNQRTGGDFALNTNYIAGTYPLLNQSTGKPWAGFGVTMLNDRSSGIFNTQQVSVSYSVNVRLSRFQLLSFGINGLHQSQRISYDGFYTGAQYIPDRGFDYSLSNGESPPLRDSYTTFSTGLHWQRTERKEQVISYGGISLYDFNKPQNSFLGGANRLSSSLIMMGGVRVYKKSKLGIMPELLYTIHSGNHTINGGLRFQYDLEATSKKVVTRVDVITKYVPGRSGIFGIQLHRENFSAGLSYDFPLLKKNVGNLGALEIGIELRREVKTRTKKLQDKRKAELAKKKALPKPVVVKKVKADSIPATTALDVPPMESMPPAPVEIVKMDSSNVRTTAKAGKLAQESLLMEKITLHFGFEFNSIDLDDETETFLNDLSTTLKEDESLHVTITGHTDNIGSEKFNQKLSQKRAEAIRGFLIKSGIEESRLVADGKGLTAPLVPNDSDANRAKNRRVEIKLYYKP